MSTRRSSRSRHIDESSEQEYQGDLPIVNDEDIEGEKGGEEEDVEEVTRCICGFDDLQIDATMNESEFDSGFFIQCEICSVWQHGYCVGIKDESESPDKYYCEICKPELHTFIFRGSKETTLYNPVNDKKKKRHGKKNNLSANISPPNKLNNPKFEEISSTTNVEESEEKKSRKDRARSLATREAEYLNLKKALEESAKESGVQPEEPELSSNESLRSTRKRRLSPKEEEEEEASIAAKEAEESNNKRKRHEGVIKDETTTTDIKDPSQKDIDEKEYSDREKERSNQRQREKEKEKEKEKEREREREREKEKEREKEREKEKEKDKERIKEEKELEAKQNRQKEERTDSSSSNSNSFSSVKKLKKKPAAKPDNTHSPAKKISEEIDLSKPSKPRLVQQRSSLSEMRKRVGAILEYIGRTQIELANEQRERNELIEYIDSFKERELETDRETAIDMKFNDFKDSFKLMDDLTRKLLIWEQKFGKYGDKLY